MTGLITLPFEGNDVRMVWRRESGWFVGLDVCAALELANPRHALSRLDADERDSIPIDDALGRPRETTIISEAGVYRLVFTSRVPAAMRFKRWVFHEVLPNLRRNGRYVLRGRRPSRDEVSQMNRQAHAAGMQAYADTFEAERRRLLAALGCADLVITLPGSTLPALDHRG